MCGMCIENKIFGRSNPVKENYMSYDGAEGLEKKKITDNTGWECPNCHKIHAPSVQRCDCLQDENQKSSGLQNINEG